MTQLRLDKVQFASNLDTYVNYATVSANVVIAYTNLPNLTPVIFSVTLPYDRVNTRADIYARNTTTNIKSPLWGSSFETPYVAVEAFDNCQSDIYYNDGSIRADFYVTNFNGHPITLIPQTFEVTAVLYEVPFSWVYGNIMVGTKNRKTKGG